MLLFKVNSPMDYPKRFKFFSDSLDTLNFNPANSTKMKREHPRNQ